MKTSPICYSALAASAAVVLTTGTVQAAEPFHIELVRDGKHQELSDQARSHIGDRLPKLFATCSFNSRDHPRLFASWGLTTIWEDAEAKDHFRIQLAKPIEIRAGGSSVISVQQFLLGLHDPRFPGPELSRHGEKVIAYVKCSGGDVIRFVCAPDVKAVMPSSYHGLCRYVAGSEHSAAQPALPADAPPAARH